MRNSKLGLKNRWKKYSLNKWRTFFSEENKREPTIIEILIFVAAFNMGWNAYKRDRFLFELSLKGEKIGQLGGEHGLSQSAKGSDFLVHRPADLNHSEQG